jgi:hypothetical protein
VLANDALGGVAAEPLAVGEAATGLVFAIAFSFNWISA